MFSSVSYLPWVNLCLHYASSVFYKHFLPFNETENPTFYVGFLGSYILETVFLILGRTFYAEVTSMDTCCWLGLQDQHLKIFIIFSLMLTYLLENKIINQVPQWSFNTLNLAIDKNDLFYNLFRLCNILLQYSIKKCKKNFSNFSIRFLRQPNTVIKYYIKSI